MAGSNAGRGRRRCLAGVASLLLGCGGSGPNGIAVGATDAGTSPAGSDSGSASAGGDAAGGACGAYGSGVFSAPNVWTKDVSCSPVAAASKTMMDALAAAGGWGTGKTQFQIDTSLVVLHADASTPTVPFTRASGYFSPDCEDLTTLPLVPGGAIEGQTGYTCDVANDDCHLLVVHPPSNKVYEIYQATSLGAGITGTCAIAWDLAKTYPGNMRGSQCTSADAAGFPLSAMLPDADEVASGAVLHAMRFVLPNARMARGVYTAPASHAGAPSGSSALPPYGARLRLRPDYPLASLPSEGARTLARALQRFGMFLADGGNVPLTIQSDQFTAHKWADLNVDSHSLYGITVNDFDVVELGAMVTVTDDCVLNP